MDDDFDGEFRLERGKKYLRKRKTMRNITPAIIFSKLKKSMVKINVVLTSHVLFICLKSILHYELNYPECTVKGDVGSDHLPVHIRLNSHEVEKALTKAVHRLDKANLQKFRKELKSIEMGDLTTPEEIEKAVELLETSMICALDKSCLQKDFFISEKTSKLIREKRKARRLAMRFSDEPEYMTMYKSLTNEVKESIKTDKERAWQDQIDKLDGARDGTEFWNSFFWLTGAKSRGTRKTPLMRSDGTHTKNDKERADTFAASLEKVHNVHQGTIFGDEFWRWRWKALLKSTKCSSSH